MTTPSALLEIGTVTKPHGLRGELKVHLFFEHSRALWEVRSVTLQSPSGTRRSVAISAVRGTNKEPILCLEDVSDRDGAEALRGHTIWVERTAVAPLEPGEYYLIDLVGCQVMLAGEVLGRVTEVRPDPSVDTMVVELAAGGFADQPVLDTWVERVDIAARIVELSSDDGLIQ